MNIDMGFDFGFGFAWGVATAITVLSCVYWIAKGCFSLGHAAVKLFGKAIHTSIIFVILLSGKIKFLGGKK